MFSEVNAVHPVGCDSPLQIVMVVWRMHFFKGRVMFSEVNAVHPVGCDSPLQIVMVVWRMHFF